MDHERMRMLQSEFEARYNPLNYNAIHEPKKLSIEKRNFDFLNQQYVKDQEWKDAKAFYNGSINLLERSVLGTLAMARDYNIATRREREPNYQPMAEGVAIIDEVLNSEHLKPFNVKGDTVAEQFRLDLVQGAGQLATQAAATILTGGAAGTALMGAQIAGNQYLDLKEAGVDTKRAAQASIANAIIQTPLERLSLGKLLKRVPAGSTLGKKLKQIGESALTEAFTEGIQQYPEEITNMIAKNEGKTIRELAVEFDKNVGTYTKNALYAGLIGGILGGGASSIRVALERNVHKEQLNTLEERIDNVKKSGADPTYAASVINANLQGETIQIDGEILYGYAQTQNIEELANSLGITQEEIVSAVDSGSTIDILRGNFEATAAQKPDFYSAVKDSVTFEDGGYSINNEHLQKEIAKEYQKVKYNLDEFENWKTEKINELRQSGATKQETLQTIVLMESAARTQYPDDPMQYFRDNPVSFKRVVSTSDGRYMQTKSANEKLLEDENNFAGIVDEYTNGKINPDKAYNVMTTPLALGLAGGKILPVTIDGNKIQHIFDGHSDGMTPELLKQIPRAMANPMMVLDSYGGRKVVVLDLKDKQGSTIIVPLELNVERNRYQVNAINNAYGKGSENGTDYNWFIEHNLKKGRVSYINKEKTAKWLQSSSSDSASKGNDLDSLLNNSIPDENALRKRREEMQGYYQTAFHGSSHRFEKFDLGAIGTGLGAQAHGWGLYFAENKEVAAEYRRKLTKSSSPYTVVYDGKIDEKITNILSRSLSGPELYAMASGKKIDLQSSIARSIEAYSRDNKSIDKLISILQEQINKIEDNPKISITKFLKEVPSDEKDRFETLAKSATQEAKAAGRRANISDVLRRQREHIEPFIKSNDRNLQDIKLLESIDTSKVEVRFPGSVFEVDIPEKEVMLDEQKAFSEQSDFVKEKLVAISKGEENVNLAQAIANNATGRKLYKAVSSVGRKASETLNKYGIEGISYHGLKDGRCFVVFDDQAIKIINSYNQKVNNDKKGEIKWDEEGKAIITMFEGADVSTVIHEAMGHYLSVNIMRQSKLPTATEQQRKDRQTLLEYAETSEEEWAELDKYDGYLTKEQFERKTAIYERWATGAEQYFMLGVAPNKELRRIFANCKKWLLGIYKSIRDFVAANKYAKEITPEVQAVFDRALASEEAIREQQKLDGYFAKLPDTILDNLSETSKRRLEAIIENAYDKAVESLTKESLKNFTKERRTEINAYRDKIAPTITESIQTERLYITGRQMTETLGEKSAATSAQKYQDLIGRAKNPEEVLTDKEQEYMLLFSAVAEQNGYASGEDFAKAVLENPTEAQAIENAIDKVVDEKFPDIVNERQAAELATKEAFYNDESGLVLGIEQQIIEDAAVGLLAKQRSTEAKMKLAKARRQQAKNAAVKMIDGMSIKDAVRVQKFIVAERNAAAKAAVAVRDGDMETALTQKRLQALNHALVMESMKTRLAVDKAGRALKRAKNAKKETWFNDNHLSQAGALFARMGIKLKGYDPENKKMTLGQYVNAMNELLGNADIAEWLFDETVDISNPTALTRQQYFDVVDAIKNIRALAKQEKGVDLLETKKDFNEFKTETLTRLQDLKTVEKLAPGEKAKINLIRKGIAQGLTSDSIYEILDKGKQGFFYNNLYLPLKHKLDLESVDLAYLTKWFETASKNWKEAVGDVYAKASYSELGVDIDGEPLKIDRTNLVKMLVYSGTQDSFRRLCDTPPVGLENSPLWVRASDTVSDEAARQATAENILSFLSNNLTSHDVVMAQELINIAEYKWSEKAENEQQTKGFAPKKQEATPRELVLADGNTVIFRGGYFPLVRDTRGGSTPTGNTPFTETNEPQLKYGMHTNTGSMKARTVGAKYPVDLTLDAGMREINASIHDLHFRKVIQGANRIFNDKDITSLMRAKLGTATFKALKEQIEVTARPEGMYNTSAAESFIGDIADKLRGKVIPYMIGMSLKINTQNLANIALYGNNVEGYGHIEALQDFITNGIMLGINSPRAAREMWKTVQELSPMMAERFKGTDFTARELMEKNKFDGVTKKVLEWSNMSMAFTDGLTAMPIWYGAYTRQMNTGKTQQEAIDYADSIIRKTMGSTRATDVSSMVRAKGATKIFFMFQTFFNTQFNQWYTTFKHQELNLSDKEYKKIAKEVSSFVFAKWATFTLFSLLLAGENPFVDDDDDDYNDFLSELFSYPFTLGGPIGQGVNFGVRRMFDMQTFPYRISPIESSLNTVFTSTSTIGKVVRGEKENEELVEPVVNLALLAKGLPSQLSKWFFNAWDILYNDMDPRVDDLFRRRPKREREE
jgi:hypothetical protein|nr:MAG TPA: crystallin beta/gamma motif-containing protein [Caudoviricetes sp.]DAW30149.1 MAG TPA: crystallin beta/gamma motif-containing protein [Caudoviricetes sp.]